MHLRARQVDALRVDANARPALAEPASAAAHHLGRVPRRLLQLREVCERTQLAPSALTTTDRSDIRTHPLMMTTQLVAPRPQHPPLPDDVIHALLPRVLPHGWYCVERGGDGAKYVLRGVATGPLTVIVSAARELDGKRWLHVSVARPHRLPEWSDLRMVKDLFMGKDRMAVQILPSERKHVNLHPFCLHLWSCLDGDVHPDFTQGGPSI